MINWLIQTNLISCNQSNMLANVVKSNGGNPIAVNVFPYTNYMTFGDEAIGVTPDNMPQEWEPTGYGKELLTKLSEGTVIPYGSTKLSKLATDFNWDGMFFNDNFNTVAWNDNRSDMLNANAFVFSVAEARVVMERFAPTHEFFIRPIHDLKTFAGTVSTADEIANWIGSKDSGSFNFPEDTLVSVAPVQQILSEWRCFVVGSKVVDISLYRHDGQRYLQHETRTEILNKAQILADEWLPHENCVMDIALTERGYKVIEFNCLNSSGFYDHDIDKIVRAIHCQFNNR